MPIYEYKCGQCGVFEVTQRITEEPLKRCPTCKGKVTRLISQTSFHLKGTGWYVTDYGRSGKSGSTGSTAGSSTETTKSNGNSAGSTTESGSKSDSAAKGSGNEKSSASA